MKKTAKKILAVILAITIVFSLSTIAFAYESIDFTGYEKYIKTFPDVKENDWFYDAVTYCSACYITGYKTGKFGPADNLQRQDFAVMMVRFNWLDEWEDEAESYNDQELIAAKWEDFVKFPDVPWNQYYTGAVNYCLYWGIITGYQNGKFGVGDKITREQAVTMLFRNAFSDRENYATPEEEFWAYEEIAEEDREAAINTVLSDFPDAAKVSGFARTAMAWAIAYGIITGKQGNIAPQANITRAEVATILARVDLDYYDWSVLKSFNGEYDE